MGLGGVGVLVVAYVIIRKFFPHKNRHRVFTDVFKTRFFKRIRPGPVQQGLIQPLSTIPSITGFP